MIPSGYLVTLKHSTRDYAENITSEFLPREKQEMRIRFNSNTKVKSRLVWRFFSNEEHPVVFL